MATVLPPWTVIPDAQGSLSSDTPGSSSSAADNSSRRPPLATWYDESNRLFIGLLDDSSSDGADMDTAGTNEGNVRSETTLPAAERLNSNGSNLHHDNGGVMMRFQTYDIPDTSNTNNTSDQQRKRPNVLSASQPISVTLPRELVYHNNQIKRDKNASSHSQSTRSSVSFGTNDDSDNDVENDVDSGGPQQAQEEDGVPMLAKLSLDQRYLALQFSPTHVRIVRTDDQAVELAATCDGDEPGNEPSATPSTTSRYCRHWTIDLGCSSLEPIQSDPHVLVSTGNMESFGAGTGAVAGAAVFRARRFLRRRNLPGGGWGGGGSFSEPFNNLLPGGIFWVDRPSDSHPILVLIATNAVLLYKVSPGKHAMRRFETYRYASGAAAAGFWYESQTRTLMVGSFVQRYEDGKNRTALEMRSYVFVQNTGPDSGKNELTTAVINPFIVRNQRQSISLDEVALVSAYNKTYCVELGCSGGGKGVKLFQIDPTERHISTIIQTDPPEFTVPADPSQVFVAVVDNVIIITNREAKMSVFLDIAAAQSGHILTDNFCAPIANDGMAALCNEKDISFLPPSYLLDPSAQGHLYGISFDQTAIVHNAPLSSFVLPFLLRRRINLILSHSLALSSITNILNGNCVYLSVLHSWLNLLGELYVQNSSSEVAKWDYEACLPLIADAALLSASAGDDTKTLQEDAQPPEFANHVLTQTELIQKVLLPHSKKALRTGDLEQINLLCDITLEYIAALERNEAPVVPALECLIIALLWRLGDGEEVVGILRSRVQWRKMLSFGEEKRQEENRSAAQSSPSKQVDVGQESLAEMLIAIATNVEYVGRDKERIKTMVLTHAIDILSSISSYQVAAKHLLTFGRVIDAITLCQKVVPIKRAALRQQQRQQQQQQQQQQMGSKMPPPPPPPPLAYIPTHGTRALDFFTAAVERAKDMPSVGDRARLLLNVHAFISDYDPDSMIMTVGDIGGGGDGTTVHGEELRSALAKKYGKFPSEMFDGTDGAVSQSLKAMFGFAIAHTCTAEQ